MLNIIIITFVNTTTNIIINIWIIYITLIDTIIIAYLAMNTLIIKISVIII